jgi:hypothetical protein
MVNLSISRQCIRVIDNAIAAFLHVNVFVYCTVVATTEEMVTSKFATAWMAKAEQVMPAENGPQAQDIIKMYCEHNYRADQGKMAALPSLGRITIIPEE